MNSNDEAFLQAASDGFLYAVKFWIDRVSSIDVQDNFGNTAFMLAIECWASSSSDGEKVARFLMEKKCSLHVRNKCGDTALTILCEKWPDSTFLSELLESMKMDSTINLAEHLNQGVITPLTIVVDNIGYRNCERGIKALLEAGSLVTERTLMKVSRRRMFKREASEKIAKMMLDCNAFVDDYFFFQLNDELKKSIICLETSETHRPLKAIHREMCSCLAVSLDRTLRLI